MVNIEGVHRIEMDVTNLMDTKCVKYQGRVEKESQEVPGGVIDHNGAQVPGNMNAAAVPENMITAVETLPEPELASLTLSLYLRDESQRNG